MKYAPREIFEQILEWSVIPTFDLVLEVKGRGYVMVKRRFAPYKGMWALPGLRMYKGESIDDVLVRIAKQEVGIDLDPSNKALIGQYVGQFVTEHHRQDLSTGYYFMLPTTTEITINSDHFFTHTISYDIPVSTGAMYRYFLNRVTGV